MNIKLDRTQPYGTIVGHSLAQYEQDGHLYDAVGDIIGHRPEYTLDAMISRGERAPDSVENAKAFLLQILGSGPVPKSIVYKEAEQNNQPWAEVTKAFEVLGAQAIKGAGKGSPTVWKLPETSNV